MSKCWPGIRPHVGDTFDGGLIHALRGRRPRSTGPLPLGASSIDFQHLEAKMDPNHLTSDDRRRSRVWSSDSVVHPPNQALSRGRSVPVVDTGRTSEPGAYFLRNDVYVGPPRLLGVRTRGDRGL